MALAEGLLKPKNPGRNGLVCMECHHRPRLCTSWTSRMSPRGRCIPQSTYWGQILGHLRKQQCQVGCPSLAASAASACQTLGAVLSRATEPAKVHGSSSFWPWDPSCLYAGSTLPALRSLRPPQVQPRCPQSLKSCEAYAESQRRCQERQSRGKTKIGLNLQAFENSSLADSILGAKQVQASPARHSGA